LSKTCLLNIRDDNAFISPEAIVKDSHTEFQFHKLTIDADERKNLINEILKDFSQRVLIPLNPSQKSLGQVLIEPMTLVACYSFVFRPNQSESWEQLW